MEGGLYIHHSTWARTSPGQGGCLLFSRLRYFDPEKKRAGVPEDVAALVDSLSADSVTVTLVNLNPTDAKIVTVQAGAYGEHQVTAVVQGDKSLDVNKRSFDVRLARGAGAKLKVEMKRFANEPTLSFPWV
jgi:hypothetical protein